MLKMVKEGGTTIVDKEINSYKKLSDSLSSAERLRLIKVLQDSEDEIWNELNKMVRNGDNFSGAIKIESFDEREERVGECTDKKMAEEYFEKNCDIVKSGKPMTGLTNLIDAVYLLPLDISKQEEEKLMDKITDAIVQRGGIKEGEKLFACSWLPEKLPEILEKTGGLKRNSFLSIENRNFGSSLSGLICDAIEKTGGLKEGCALEFQTYNGLENLQRMVDNAIKEGKHCRLYYGYDGDIYFIENGVEYKLDRMGKVSLNKKAL